MPIEDGAWTVQTAEISDATNKEDSATVKPKERKKEEEKNENKPEDEIELIK